MSNMAERNKEHHLVMGYSSASGREAEHDLVMGNIVRQDAGMDNMTEK